jgi:KaiC/GvpD/RAD55 family RecA-like ATPase
MTTRPQLQKFDGSAIPDELKALRRWAPWKGVYNAERGKFDKIPRRADRPEYGLSTASPEKWYGHDEALTTYIKSKGMLDGIGFVMTGIEDVVGLDLDDCLDAQGNVVPWALEIINTANSYTEISPSGNGLRIFALGQMDGADWNNHEVGIAVYGGESARFLTVTGKRFKDAPTRMGPITPGFLANLRGTYGRATTAARIARKDVPMMPDLLPVADTPAVPDIELPPAVVNFLLHGEVGDDRSRTLHSTGVALYSAGLNDQQVFSVLAHNAHAMEIALGHRRHDIDKAHDYLWVNQCWKAKGKARPRALTMEDFDDLSATLEVPVDDDAGPVSAGGSVADDFDDVSGGEKPPAKAPEKKGRYNILSALDYTLRVRKLNWFVKGVLPKADLAAIFGASGSGKTFITLDLACRIAMGMEWFGIETAPAKVLYVAAEGASGMRDRVMAWCIANNVALEDLAENLFILGDQPDMTSGEHVKALVNAARGRCPDVELVVLDTMAQVTPGANENSGEDMGKFLSHCKLVSKVLKATVVLVGHSGKDANKGLRGWSGLKGAMDAECEVIRTKDFRALVVTKLKDGRGEGKEYRFTLPEVLVDIDVDEGDVTSLVALHGEVFDESGARDVAASEKAKAKPTSDRKTVWTARMKVVLEYLREKAKESGPRIGYDVLIPELSALCTADGRDGVGFTAQVVAEGNQRTTLKATFDALEKAGEITHEKGVGVTVLGVVVENPGDVSRDF